MSVAAALSGQGAIVTGGGGAIGRAIARTLAGAGAHVLAVDAGTGAAAETCAMLEARHGGRHDGLGIDITAVQAPDLIVARMQQLNASCDILVNCAGITGASTELVDTDIADWDRVYAVNVRAPFLLMQQVAPGMIARKSGRIVNVTSSSAHRARGARAAYASSKSALMQLSRVAAGELGPHGITVNAVAPGLTRTNMVTTRFTEEEVAALLTEGPTSNLLRRLSEPEDIAASVLFLCLPSGRQITAQTLHISGGAIL
ncbi:MULTISPECIES: SDR family NAD(P)-dependent oxidoreductase [unclassified Sphingobium]|uniref:SDR family NAD(P)-dependent oxidoreductase n=1 Tax=unclassified Sphingobium TaxID=2611147 RepID=UPI000D15E494|nr:MULTISPECIES: SDR family oxidoreductase [unclassified Sphingobium]MBG6119972.1 NAD(P)-dependent dehydrogenase (short-subunit alcohol dehydrogenase family) [Sphingobium sp. JAI105]PSO11861.1 short-chain dehydrogenase [Sphingobium sp. AEW4]TWC99589.1 3-oxoacyl-[acyl-carrier protein] reductase [Sphingobium sp. AEW010]TWD18974.1 3-oxoacyl-[acyl-carrier protein] reductase [Sphingobium sp. AEW013]TWD21845.1 3-oxoacyl-[acyl-carrier protein] reductase [Sphingobium sp. AEW001]